MVETISHPQVPQRRTFRYPAHFEGGLFRPFSTESIYAAALAQELKKQGVCIASSLPKIALLNGEAVAEFKDSSRLFNHPLKSLLPNPSSEAEALGGTWLNKTIEELAVFEKWNTRDPIAGALTEPRSLVDLLCRINADLREGGGILRNGDVMVRAPDLRNVTVYPEAGAVTSNLSHLSTLLAALPQRTDAERAYLAVVAYCGIIHAHPFPDGNGRTARTVFALLTSQLLGCVGFPLITLASRLSDGVYIIASRRALFGYGFADMLKVLRDGIVLSNWLHHTAS